MVEEIRCPRRPIFDQDRFYYKVFSLFSMYKDGFLPEVGGINDQPALLVEMFEQLKMTNNVMDAEDQERAADEGGDGNAGGQSILRR